MKTNTSQPGVTLVELLVAIGIIAILAVGMFTVGEYVNTQAKEKLAQSTIAIVVAALEEFHEYGYKSYSFPPDCNEFTKTDLEDELEKFVDASSSPVINIEFDETYSSSSALYFCLSRVPTSKKVIDSINVSLLSNKDVNNDDLEIAICTQTYPLIRIVDPWGTAIRYTYESDDNFPVITSAGPDKTFDTNDDITSK